MGRGKTAPELMTDEEIIALYWERDEQAIRETDIKYGKMLFRIAYNILHDKHDCEECKNDTLFGVWNTIPPKRPLVLPAFVTRIMRNVAIKRYREKTADKRIPTELTISMEELQGVLQDGDTPEAGYAAKELGRMISNYLRTLTERGQYIFIGRFYMAETMEHLARRLGVGVGTVHREIVKIKQGLKAHLERNGVYI